MAESDLWAPESASSVEPVLDLSKSVLAKKKKKAKSQIIRSLRTQLEETRKELESERQEVARLKKELQSERNKSKGTSQVVQEPSKPSNVQLETAGQHLASSYVRRDSQTPPQPEEVIQYLLNWIKQHIPNPHVRNMGSAFGQACQKAEFAWEDGTLPSEWVESVVKLLGDINAFYGNPREFGIQTQSGDHVDVPELISRLRDLKQKCMKQLCAHDIEGTAPWPRKPTREYYRESGIFSVKMAPKDETQIYAGSTLFHCRQDSANFAGPPPYLH